MLPTEEFAPQKLSEVPFVYRIAYLGLRVPGAVPLARVVGLVVHDRLVGQVLEQLPPQGAGVRDDRGVGRPGSVVHRLVPVALDGIVFISAIANFHAVFWYTSVQSNPSG